MGHTFLNERHVLLFGARLSGARLSVWFLISCLGFSLPVGDPSVRFSFTSLSFSLPVDGHFSR